jgi:hypothetical protein
VTGKDRFLRRELATPQSWTPQLTRNVILWLSDIHPESLHIIRVELVISSNRGEDLLFDRSWSELCISFSSIFWRGKAHLNTVQDLGVEEVDTGVNPVSDEFDGFLDESINDCRVGFGDYDTVVGRLGDFGYLLSA